MIDKEILAKYALGLGEYALYNRPDVILNHIPLYNVQYLEVALSQDDLKFRAEGYTYVGNQEGANSGIRITCILDGPMQDVILSAIEYTFLWCKGGGETRNVNYHIDNIVHRFNTYDTTLNVNYIASPTQSVSSTFTGKDRIMKKVKPTEYIDTVEQRISGDDPDLLRGTTKYGKLKKKNEYKHRRTFVLMSSDNVMFKLFIQTYIYRHSVINGNNVTILHLFLRRYDPVTDIDFTIEDNAYYNGGELDLKFDIDIDRFVLDTGINSVNNFGQLTADDTKYIDKLGKSKSRITRFGMAEETGVDPLTYEPTYDVKYYDKLSTTRKVTPNFDQLDPKRIDRTIYKYNERRANDTSDFEFKIRLMHRMMSDMLRVNIDKRDYYLLNFDRSSPVYNIMRLMSPKPSISNVLKVIM